MSIQDLRNYLNNFVETFQYTDNIIINNSMFREIIEICNNFIHLNIQKSIQNVQNVQNIQNVQNFIP